jgi:hypothetical protein
MKNLEELENNLAKEKEYIENEKNSLKLEKD